MPDPAPAPEVHPDVRHERSDANLRFVIWFGAILVIMLVLVHVVVLGLFASLRSEVLSRDPELTAIEKQGPHFPADIDRIPEPRLQVTETRDLRKQHEWEDAILTQPAWVDESKGIVRIPIDEAIRQFADPQTAQAHGIVARDMKKGKK